MASTKEISGQDVDVQSAEAIDINASHVTHDHGEYKRVISARQIHVISLGSQIGGGILIATGRGLSNAGPLGALLGYGLVATSVWAVLQVLGEMTVAFPTSGNFIDYADRFLHPSIAFAAGFAEWLGWCAVLGSEAVFFNLVLRQWTNAVPDAVWITLFILATISLFSLPTAWFAWYEYATSAIKILGMVMFLLIDFAIIFGAGPEGKMHHGETWHEGPVVKNGFGGFSSAALLGLWAMADQVFVTIMGGEATSPRLSISRAAKTVPVRVTTLFLLTILFSSLLISPDDPRLFGGSSPNQSPFTIAMYDAGIHGFDQFLRVLIILSCLGFGAEAIYIASRILRALSHQGLIPEFIAAKVDSRGRPIWSLIITGCVSVALTYINLSGTGTEIFTWLASITSSAFFIVWLVIAVTSFRFHAALKSQKDRLFTEVFAWRCFAWPVPAYWLLATSLLLFICCIYSGLFPLGTHVASAESFFQYNIGVVIVIAFTIAHKFIYRTKFRSASSADLVTGRRTLQQDEIEMLQGYYSAAAWRRGIGYCQFW